MEHITLASKEKLHRSSVWEFYFAGRRAGVLDIETTGLDRVRNRFILGGIYDPEEGVLHQIFAENTGQETEALEAFMRLVEGFDVIVTYNGRHFDMPFLAERLRRTGLLQAPAAGGKGNREAPIPGPYGGFDLDLYQVVNGHSPLRRLLPNLRQKTVETYMGLWTDRADEISGAESVELYARYERTADPRARQKILLHNSDDVLQLTRLTAVMDKCDVHRAMYHMGFPVGSPGRRWRTSRIGTVRDQLIIEGLQGVGRRPDQDRQAPAGSEAGQSGNGHWPDRRGQGAGPGLRLSPVEYRGYGLGEFPLYARFDAKAGHFRIELPITRQSGIAAFDLRGAGLKEEEFKKYPGYGSGFLVIEEGNEVKYRQTNHLVQALMARLEAAM